MLLHKVLLKKALNFPNHCSIVAEEKYGNRSYINGVHKSFAIFQVREGKFVIKVLSSMESLLVLCRNRCVKIEENTLTREKIINHPISKCL